MKNRLKLIFFIVITMVINNLNGQTNIVSLYDRYIQSNEIGGTNSILTKVDSHTSRYFILVSYYIDSNNIMYEKTNNPKYLKLNESVLKVFKSKKGAFLGKFYKNEQNYVLDGKESILLEGYLFRYFAKYYYHLSLMSEEDLIKYNLDFNYDFLENRFIDWFNRSIKSKGDDSFLQGIRLHMGAQWATTALYLLELTNDKYKKKIYTQFLDRFNKELHNNIRIINRNKHQLFVWNSTYNNAFTAKLKERYAEVGKESLIQDTPHGNHVVDYILSASKLGYGKWNENSINILVNTLKYSIFQPSNTRFAKLVHNVGEKQINDNLDFTEIKVSDGWMKLLEFDNELRSVFLELVNQNQSKLKFKHYYNQILANLVLSK